MKKGKEERKEEKSKERRCGDMCNTEWRELLDLPAFSDITPIEKNMSKAKRRNERITATINQK